MRVCVASLWTTTGLDNDDRAGTESRVAFETADKDGTLTLYRDACTYRKPANSSSMRANEISSARRTHVDTRNQFAGNAT